jgi:hypothetical protein
VASKESHFFALQLLCITLAISKFEKSSNNYSRKKRIGASLAHNRISRIKSYLLAQQLGINRSQSKSFSIFRIFLKIFRSPSWQSLQSGLTVYKCAVMFTASEVFSTCDRSAWMKISKRPVYKLRLMCSIEDYNVMHVEGFL